LGGHTDNIRAVLISDEGKWVCVGSSTTIHENIELKRTEFCRFSRHLPILQSNSGLSPRRNVSTPSLITILPSGRSSLNIRLSKSSTLETETATSARSTSRVLANLEMVNVCSSREMDQKMEQREDAEQRVSLSLSRRTIVGFGQLEEAVQSSDGRMYPQGREGWAPSL